MEPLLNATLSVLILDNVTSSTPHLHDHDHDHDHHDHDHHHHDHHDDDHSHEAAAHLLAKILAPLLLLFLTFLFGISPIIIIKKCTPGAHAGQTHDSKFLSFLVCFG